MRKGGLLAYGISCGSSFLTGFSAQDCLYAEQTQRGQCQQGPQHRMTFVASGRRRARNRGLGRGWRRSYAWGRGRTWTWRCRRRSVVHIAENQFWFSLRRGRQLVVYVFHQYIHRIRRAVIRNIRQIPMYFPDGIAVQPHVLVTVLDIVEGDAAVRVIDAPGDLRALLDTS